MSSSDEIPNVNESLKGSQLQSTDVSMLTLIVNSIFLISNQNPSF